MKPNKDDKVNTQPNRPEYNMPSKTDNASAAYILGGILIFVALNYAIFMHATQLSDVMIALIAIVYSIGFCLIGTYLWMNTTFKNTGGIFATIAVLITPIWVWYLLSAVGFIPSSSLVYVLLSWASEVRIIVAATTILVALAVLYKVKFSFLTVPVYFSFLSLTTNSVDALTQERFTDLVAPYTAIVMGLIYIIVNYRLDKQTKDSFVVWGYLCGLLFFWLGLTDVMDVFPFYSILYFIVSILLLVMSVLIRRVEFLVFGLIGLWTYLVYIVTEFSDSSWYISLVLSIIGIIFIVLGYCYQKIKDR